MTDPISRFREASEAHDLDAALSTLADDVVIHSPLTDRAKFTGHAEARALFEVVYQKLADLKYHTTVGDGSTRVLVGVATVGGQRIDSTYLLTVDDHDRISELTLFVRPLPGLTALMAALGPPMARAYGRSRFTAGLLRAMTAPLVFATRAGDRTGIPLALPAKGSPARRVHR
jgi:hypothetical protein